MRSDCGICKNTELTEVKFTTGSHYAKMVCSAGHFVGWVPWPPVDTSEIPEAVLALIASRRKPAPLRGSQRQVAFAESVRTKMVSFAGRNNQALFSQLAYCVNDASWFIANQDRFPPNLKCWPRVDQMEPVEVEAIR